MDPKPLKVVGWFLLMILAVVAALRLDHALFPTATVNPPPGLTSRDLIISIDDKGQGPQASDLTGVSRAHRDYVRWENHTDKSFELHFTNNPSTPDDDNGPFPDACTSVIVVPPSGCTGWYRVANRPAEHGKSIRYNYRSTTAPLSGPPGEPGMTVEE